jgi:glycosyltransferase involved in cell wall biosynthesis
MNNNKNKTKPLISVIVTTYNRKNELKQAVKSILAQTFDNFEIIIVDNYSDYNIHKLINSFKDLRIVLIQNHNNGNYVISRNLGIKKAKGSFIAFCDDDDYWLPHKLESQLKLFDNKKDVGLVYSKCYMLKNNKIYRTAPNMKLYNGYVFHKMIVIPSVPILTALVRREVFNKIGLFNKDRAVICQEDNEFWIRLSKYFKVKSSEEPTAVYREHTGNFANEHGITFKARLYLHRHMLRMKTISLLEWFCFALPGMIFSHFGRKVIFIFRRFIQ